MVKLSKKNDSPIKKIIRAWEKDDDTLSDIIRYHLENKDDDIFKSAFKRAFKKFEQEEALGLLEDVYYEASYLEDEETGQDHSLVMIVALRPVPVPNEELPATSLLDHSDMKFLTPWYPLSSMNMLPSEGYHFLKGLLVGEVAENHELSPDAGLMICFGVKTMPILSDEEIDKRDEMSEEEQNKEIQAEVDKELMIQAAHYSELWKNPEFANKFVYISHPYTWGRDDKADMEEDLKYLVDELLQIRNMRNFAYEKGLILKVAPHELSHRSLLLLYKGQEVVEAEESRILLPQAEFLLANDEYLNSSVNILMEAMSAGGVNELSEDEMEGLEESPEGDEEDEEELPQILKPSIPSNRILH